MFTYDDPTAVDGEFSDGNPLSTPPVPRTVLRSIWTNMIQRELISVVEGAGLTLDGEEFDQVFKAILALINSGGGGRVGEIITMTMDSFSTPPDGCLPLDGALVSRSSYPELWTFAQTKARLVSDTSWAGNLSNRPSYSSGNGSSTFRLPDVRGVFPRWWGGAGTWDAGRLCMTMQGDQNRSHSHGTQHTLTSNGGGLTGNFIENGAGGDGSVDVSNRLTINIEQSGGNEARPVNAAFPAFVRYRSVS